MTTFNKAAIVALLEAVKGVAQGLGVFQRAHRHEPKNAPGLHLSFALWVHMIEPLPAASGLASVSGLVTLMARIYNPFTQKPEDDIDPSVLDAAGQFIGALAGGLTLGGTVRNIDVMGQFGQKLAGQAGYLDQDGTKFRVIEVTIPVVMNDLWTEAA